MHPTNLSGEESQPEASLVLLHTSMVPAPLLDVLLVNRLFLEASSFSGSIKSDGDFKCGNKNVPVQK